MNSHPAINQSYVIALLRKEVDRFSHNVVLARELERAFAVRNIELRAIDYINNSKMVHAALADQSCKFFIAFNGFGSEIKVHAGPGVLRSTYEVYGKPLYDVMHDCPAHETMSHQFDSTFGRRILLSTDHSYAAIAKDMGVANVRYVTSFTFPTTVGDAIRPVSDRKISVLLPIGITDPRVSKGRHGVDTLKGRVFQSIFECVTTRCITDCESDPILAARQGFRAADIEFSFNNVDCRFLISTILDYVKFERRRRLLEAIAHLPVTVIADRQPGSEYPTKNLIYGESRSFAELIALMGDAQCVICPGPHFNGFHERVFAAMSAGSAVVSTPNLVLETHFMHNRDIVFARNEGQLAATVERIFDGAPWLQQIATCGRELSAVLFSPQRFVDMVLSIDDMRRAT
jgi:hypothetical protein